MREKALRSQDKRHAPPSPSQDSQEASPTGVPLRCGHQLSSLPILPPQVFQAKLDISQPGDSLEEEADQVADEVTRSQVQHVRRTVRRSFSGDQRRAVGVSVETPGDTPILKAITATRSDS